MRADGVIVPSFGVADVAAHWSGVEDGQLRVVPNAVDADSLVPEARPARDPASPLRAVFLGRLDPVKRVPMLAQAVRRLDGVTLDIFGDGLDRDAIEPFLNDRIRMHGPADRETALANADVLVLPSEAEGFGLVLLEAMAAGVPVVASDVPGIRDVVTDGETGLLFRDDLASTLVEVRDDPEAAAERATAALADVADRFTWPANIERYRELLG